MKRKQTFLENVFCFVVVANVGVGFLCVFVVVFWVGVFLEGEGEGGGGVQVIAVISLDREGSKKFTKLFSL